MNILIVGSGGREHTLAWKLKQSTSCNNLFVAPGNAGTANEGTNLPISITDFEALKLACISNEVSLVIVGPEEPLVKGIVDDFANDARTRNIHVIGPSSAAAQLEGSKAFAKSFMNRNNIPTAAYKKFTADNYAEGIDYIRSHSLPIVLKADGLAAGKGVLICNSHIEALAEFELIIHRAKFGEAGNKVVVEAFLEGIEVSIFVLTDGENYLMLPEAKDYKRIGMGDTGLNTGGMGAVSPLPFFDGALREKIIRDIVEPTIKGLQNDKLEYKGFIFIGLMINADNEPFVIEYNCRLGDPETQVVIPRIKNDLVEVFQSVFNGKINEMPLDIDARAAAAIVAVSGGYPGTFEKGYEINGLMNDTVGDSLVFQAGTSQDNGAVVTNGGRVLSVTAFGEDIREASEQSVYMMEQLHFEDMYFRSDIGYEFK